MHRIVHNATPVNQRQLIIDVGCGTGANIASFNNNYRCIGIDISNIGINLARKRFPLVKFICGSAPDDIAKEMKNASLILMTDVLEHVCDDFDLFSRILAQIPPGAYMLVTVPANISLWSAHDISLDHYRRYDQERLMAIWDGLPVATHLLSYFNTRLLPVVKSVRTLNRIFGKHGGKYGTDLSMPPDIINKTLIKIFAGESNRLLAVLNGNKRPYSDGVSMIALLQKTSGTVKLRCKPSGLKPDLHNPDLQTT